MKILNGAAPSPLINQKASASIATEEPGEQVTNRLRQLPFTGHSLDFS